MTPEILFRGKRVDNGEWVYGYYANCAHPRGPESETRHYIISYPGGVKDYHEIYTATVGPYIGLTDKNGVKIFEGDVVKVCLNPDIEIGIVEWGGRIASFIVKFPEDECITFLDVFQAKARVQEKVWVEVIGNVHDNPELLEGDKK